MEGFVAIFTVFVLAIFVGFEVITKVPPILHTPLMSGSNAISGITVIGALILAGSKQTTFTTILGFAAVGNHRFKSQSDYWIYCRFNVFGYALNIVVSVDILRRSG